MSLMHWAMDSSVATRPCHTIASSSLDTTCSALSTKRHSTSNDLGRRSIAQSCRSNCADFVSITKSPKIRRVLVGDCEVMQISSNFQAGFKR